jgi:hypothetical protein
MATIDELIDIKKSVEGGAASGVGPRVLFNEAQTEVIIIIPVENFAELDAIHGNDKNAELGLRLIKAGLVHSGLEFWHDIPGNLPRYRSIYSGL